MLVSFGGPRGVGERVKNPSPGSTGTDSRLWGTIAPQDRRVLLSTDARRAHRVSGWSICNRYANSNHGLWSVFEVILVGHRCRGGVSMGRHVRAKRSRI